MNAPAKKQTDLERYLAILYDDLADAQREIDRVQGELAADPAHVHRWRRTSNGYGYCCDCGNGCGPVGLVEAALRANGDIVDETPPPGFSR